jgi:3'-phosphoadenosine 5'-phosphosulfate sulfotransferase (PAPS reductase)/FAD synthetase
MNIFGSSPFHLVGLSGGKDSTALALLLKERHPEIPYRFYCTPTGDELPEMFEWWKRLGELLGTRIIPIMQTTLLETIARNKALPNFRMRFCTRAIKIEPLIELFHSLAQVGEVHSYIGLRADEESRVGGVFDSIANVSVHFPLREMGWRLSDVWAYLREKKVADLIPQRTDCALCFYQRIGEWWRLWLDYPERFEAGVALEQKYGKTFRSPGRDSWPIGLAEMRTEFEKGSRPKTEGQLELFERSGMCRVCSL